MGLTLENVAMYLGQALQDVYSRKIGIMVGVYSEVDGTVTAVEVMINDNNYETIPADKLELREEGLRIIPDWLVEARRVERKLDILKKRIKALDELYKKGQIPQHAYKELKERLDQEISKVRNDVRNVKEIMKKKVYELENFIIHLEKAMTNLMVSYTAGELPENGFKVSADFIRYAKQATLDEKKDVEKHSGTIAKLEEELNSILKTLEEAEKERTALTLPVTSQPGPITVKVTG